MINLPKVTACIKAEPRSASSQMPLTLSPGRYYKPWLIYPAFQNPLFEL